MAKFRCTICGYVYDESKGDEKHGMKKGTKFSDLPNDWVCPICGAQKNMFEEL
jgi:rubredoxin